MRGSIYSIDRKEQVPLGGLPQTIHIWGTRRANPVLLFLHSLLLGTGADGFGAATSTGIRQTALVAMIFVALSVVIYCFYNDKEITRVLREGT